MNESKTVETILVKRGAAGYSVPLDTVGRCLLEGGVVAFPTETVYGIGVKPDDEAAVSRIFEIKERDRGKPLTMHISDASAVRRFSDAGDDAVFRLLAARFWPGPLTMVLPKRSDVPDFLTGGLDTIAFRFPSHPLALEFISGAGGAVAGTSANISGGFSATTAKAVLADLGGMIEYVLEGDAGIIGIESTVISLAGGVKMLRRGAIGAGMLNSVIGCEALAEDEAVAGSKADARRAAKSKIRFYEVSEGQLVVEKLVLNEGAAAVLLSDRVFYNLEPIISSPAVKKRVRVLSWEGYVTKVYKVLRQLDSPEISEIYVPRLVGSAVDDAVNNLLTLC